MPRIVAVVSVVAGIAVIAFGGFLATIEPPSSSRATDDVAGPTDPVATLEPAGTPAPLDSRSDISGTVQSPDGRSLEDVRVELVPLFERDGADARGTETSSDGSYAFEDVRLDLGSPYVVEAVYDDVRFASPVLRAPRGTDPEVDLTVARTTTSPKKIEVSVESLAIVGGETGVQAVHAITVENTGDRAFVGELELPLLRGAANIQETGGLDRRRLDLSHGRMVSTAPVLPGRTELTYTYVTQMSKEGIALTRRPQLPTERFILLAAGALTLADERGLRREGSVDLGSQEGRRTYRRWLALDVGAGASLRARIVVDEGPGLVRVGAPVAAAVAALALFGVGLLRRRRRGDPGEPAARDTEAQAPTPA